jgi:hypothetical protein
MREGSEKELSHEKRNVRENERISVNELDEQIRRLVDNKLAEQIGEPISFL